MIEPAYPVYEVTMDTPHITKGTKIQVEFFASREVALSGMQMKTEAQLVNVIGTCVHFRGDHPTDPSEIEIFIDVTEGVVPDHVKLVKPHGCTHEKGHLKVKESWIKGVEKDGKTYRVSF